MANLPKNKRNITPPWRDFEQLVTRIEHLLAGATVKVVSPDRIRSIITGRMREVDASLRARVGSSELLVTIECRKRKATQDVTWIEQLSSKKQAIGAARTIAVASTAFSMDAVKAAAHYGIDLRVLSEITDTDVQDWILPQSVVHVFKWCDLTESPEILLIQEGDDDFTTLSTQDYFADVPPNMDSPVFIAPDGTDLTLNDIWLRADEQLKIFDKVPCDDRTHILLVTLNITDNLRIRTKIGSRRVRQIKLPIALRWQHEEIPLSKAIVVSYRPVDSSDGMPSQIRAEFETKESMGTNLRLGMQFEPGCNSMSFDVQTMPGKK